MTTEDKANVAPEMDKPAVTPEEAKAPETVIVPPIKEVDPKYAGKSLEEIIEMHKNAESLATKKAQELAELKKAKPEPTVDEIAAMFSPAITQEDDPRDKELAELKQAQLASRLEMDVLKAKTRSDLPEWTEYEGEILELAKAKPGILFNNKDWVKDCYNMVLAEKLPAKLQEAEERGKKIMTDKEIPKAEASIISGAEIKTPPPPPEPTRSDKIREVHKGKVKMVDLLKADLSDAELTALNSMTAVKGK